MSRIFGYLASGFWRHPKVRHLGEDDASRLFMTYIFSCSHGNSAGCFVLPFAYIAADLRWDIAKVAKVIAKCSEAKLIDYDDDHDVLRIRGWFNQNPPSNFNVAMSIVRIVTALPECDIKKRLITTLRESDNQHIRDTVEGLPGGSGKVGRPARRKPLNKKEQAKQDLAQAKAHQKIVEAFVQDGMSGEDAWSLMFAAQSPIPGDEREKAILLCMKKAKEKKIKWIPPKPGKAKAD